jgi:putative ABC transport system permease protein
MTGLRQAYRALRRTPAFAAGAIATVALTVGATTAIFSVVYGVLLRQLPYRDVDRIYWIWSDQPGRDRTPFNVPDFLDYRRGVHTLDGFAGYFAYGANLSDEAAAERLQGLRVTGEFFDVLGARSRLGRLLATADERPGSDHVVVLSEPLWRRRFGADPRTIGQVIRLNSETFTVVGVIAAGFATPIRDVDFAVPFLPGEDARRGARNSLNFIHGVGRIGVGVPVERATADLNAIAKRLQQQYPVANARKRGVRLVALVDGVVGPFRTALLTVFGAVAGVLLVACANLANLMLTRAAGRRKELAVQLALGASRAAVIRQVLVEALLIAAAGGTLGVLLAQWGAAGLVIAAPADLPRVGDVRIDASVLLFSLGLSTLTGVLFGVLPALASANVDIREALQSSGRGVTGGGHRVRGILVSAEVALAVGLLVVMTMLAKSFARVQAVEPGFDPARVLSARLTLPARRYDTRDSIVAFQRALDERLSSISTVTGAGAISLLPLSGMLARVPFTVDGRPVERERVPFAQFRIVSAGYFDAAHIPITRGRGFLPSDTGANRAVAVVSQELARRWLDGLDPIGARLLVDDNDAGPRPIDIVGVAGNVQQMTLDGGATWDLYLPYPQMHTDSVGLAAGNMFWVVRTTAEPMNLASVFGRELHRIDPDVVASQIQPMGRYLSDALAPRRYSLSMIAAFALAALVLAMTGIYAIIVYAVSERAREIAIRLALGASPARIVRLVVGVGARFVGLGLVAGIGLAIVATRLVSTQLFGIPAGDVATLGEVASVVAILSLVACAVPATRIGRFLGLVMSAE